ncbi:HesA/MoeB/ThiF family protein [Desulfobacula phenolica]|uniref:Molybdopterin or thiamine biosynthesis adenylyltransferase n=1 Tax=Desulfobacula phenolica TaxID=90732 RepID=A0A1H2EG78_9BACT|nr:HesA/MoeB/ThiF family protein [Desulfobacula phenolica]SDT94044.1 Molybdopterin or thiamine biosynthesis adenylyltransferase [Desulfobacula phenolica]
MVSSKMVSSKIEGRYDRNFNTLTREEQTKLGNSKVVVIGLGGLGGGVCEMLARVGVGHLTLIDGDSFEASNLNRQLLSEEHLIGIPKAEAAKARVNSVNSEVIVTHRVEYVDESNLYETIKESDVVMDCLDSIDTRFKLQDAAKKASVPIVSGAIAGVTGQMTTIFPEDMGYELIYGKKSREQSKGVELRTGNMAYCALFVAALQSSECVKILLDRGDLLRNKLLIAELWTNTFEVMELV